MTRDLTEPLSLAQKESRQRAVAKVVALGAQVGVGADQMIELLQSGRPSANCWITWRLGLEKWFEKQVSKFQGSRVDHQR
ncbi:MAG TPA: hypothetical protein VIX14_00940 [Terriglobales bacterium]